MKISEFLSENFQFLVVKFSLYLNRRVFVMTSSDPDKTPVQFQKYRHKIVGVADTRYSLAVHFIVSEQK